MGVRLTRQMRKEIVVEEGRTKIRINGKLTEVPYKITKDALRGKEE